MAMGQKYRVPKKSYFIGKKVKSTKAHLRSLGFFGAPRAAWKVVFSLGNHGDVSRIDLPYGCTDQGGFWRGAFGSVFFWGGLGDKENRLFVEQVFFWLNKRNQTVFHTF